ncbi:DUF1489 family protein [Fodinicurvata halophila]|uniref:DUF1489 family protein n=1 Tax=Fodinicurvata halophila TaxID=1419723 RepID=UPI003624D337
MDSLTEFQERRLATAGGLWHDTRMMPRRRAELLDGGSVYWVIKGLVQARQPLEDIEERVDEEGRSYARLVLKPGLVRVAARQQRPFQGWRYLPSEQAPADLGQATDSWPRRRRRCSPSCGRWVCCERADGCG